MGGSCGTQGEDKCICFIRKPKGKLQQEDLGIMVVLY